MKRGQLGQQLELYLPDDDEAERTCLSWLAGCAFNWETRRGETNEGTEKYKWPIPACLFYPYGSTIWGQCSSLDCRIWGPTLYLVTGPRAVHLPLASRFVGSFQIHPVYNWMCQLQTTAQCEVQMGISLMQLVWCVFSKYVRHKVQHSVSCKCGSSLCKTV